MLTGTPSLKINLQLFGEEEGFNDDVILPEGFTEETPTEVNEEVVEEVAEGIEETVETPNIETPQTIKIKYNHEEKELTLEEATQLAQKGLNYDKLQQKINEFQNHPGLQYLNDLANRNGMQVEDLVQYWKQQEEQAMLNELLEKNIPEEYAKEMLESRKFREEQLKAQKAQEEEMLKKQEDENQVKDFLEAYPNVKPTDIPQEVWDKAQQGVPLKYAYMEHEHKQLSDRVKILETNLNNKKKAPISNGVGDFGTDEPIQEDDFLKGFNSI